LESLQHWKPLINQHYFPLLAVVFVILGVILFSWFFVYEVATEATEKKDLKKELTLAGLASFTLGLATLFCYASFWSFHIK